eukprot:2385587-Prymnesium_polylepis.1
MPYVSNDYENPIFIHPLRAHTLTAHTQDSVSAAYRQITANRQTKRGIGAVLAQPLVSCGHLRACSQQMPRSHKVRA